MLNWLKKNILPVILFLLMALLGLGRAFNDIPPYATGDGPEYVLTTEALYNHFSPDIRYEDAQSFKKSYTALARWDKNFKYPNFDDIEAWLKIPNKEFMSMHGGIYVAENKKSYGYHFFFYSLINVPARLIAELVKGDPLRCFQVTNAFLILSVCFYFLFFSRLKKWSACLLSLSFFFSSVYWYTGWTHPEVFTACLVALGVFFFLNNRIYWSLALISIAATQNQPLIVLLAFIFLKHFLDVKLQWKSLFKAAAISLPAVFPPLFYLIHFGTTNLIKDAGFLSTDYIHFTRVFGFYWDFNQGVLLAIPLILIAYVGIIITNSFKQLTKKENFSFDILLPLVLIVMTCVVSTMGNWNHGQAIINRYATWFSAIILVHTFYLFSKNDGLVSIVFQNYFFASQAFTTLYHEQFNQYDWDMSFHKPLAKYFLEYHPSIYNPDPTIFIVRTTHGYNTGPSASPVFYYRDKKNPNSSFFQITKMAVHENAIQDLTRFGFSQEDLNKLKPRLNYVNGWAYINKGELNSKLSAKEIFYIERENKLKIKADQIKENKIWVEDIKRKANEWGKTFDEVLRLDAEYLLSEEEKAE